MDNNNQNNVFGGQPANNTPFGQQAPMGSGMKFNLLELISLICAGIGLLMVVLGTVLTCTCSAKTFMKKGEHTLSAVFIVTIFGIMFSIAAIILAVMAMKQKDAAVKAGKFSRISFVVGCFAAVFGIMPMVTICGYNCSLNNAMEDMNDLSEDDFEDSLGDLHDLF